MDKDEDPCEICGTDALNTPNTHVELANSPPLIMGMLSLREL